MPERPPPRFYGVDTYLDPRGRFDFRFPTTWQHDDLDGREGAMYLPNPADPHTSLSAWVTALEDHVVAEDLEALREGVDEGVAKLPGAEVEAASEVVLSNLIKFERIFTFRDGDAVRKRKTWILYVDTWVIVVTWQGSSVEEYDYWLAMANYSYATFHIPESLWFATDRDLVGHAPR